MPLMLKRLAERCILGTIFIAGTKYKTGVLGAARMSNFVLGKWSCAYSGQRMSHCLFWSAHHSLNLFAQKMHRKRCMANDASQPGVTIVSRPANWSCAQGACLPVCLHLVTYPTSSLGRRRAYACRGHLHTSNGSSHARAHNGSSLDLPCADARRVTAFCRP